MFDVMCVYSPQVVFLSTLLYNTIYSTVVEYLYFKPRMSRSRFKSSGDIADTVLLRHHWIIFTIGYIESSKQPQSVPSESGVSEITACPPSPIAGDLSALSSLTSLPSSGQ